MSYAQTEMKVVQWGEAVANGSKKSYNSSERTSNDYTAKTERTFYVQRWRAF